MKIIIFFIIFNLYFNQKCLQVEKCICSNNGANCLSENNIPKDMIGYFNFDNAISNDLTGNFIISPFPFGAPGKNKDGFSLNFKRLTMYEIKNKSTYSKEITIMFWLYIREFKGWTSIIYDKNKSFSLRINPDNGNLKIVFQKNKELFSYNTNSNLIEKKWTHVSLIISEFLVKIYINGYLDISKKFNNLFDNKKLNINFGSDKVYKSSLMYLDELKIFNKNLNDGEIYDNYNDNSSFNEYDDYKIGCNYCSYVETLNKCKDDYHMCSLSEVYSGAFQFARSNGLLKNGNQIWYKIDNYNLLIKQNDKKLGICCKNI